ncbi:MAG TPA: hypothetical protein PKC18_16600, partial [Lacipirellulaceae bacterium]|nr:hypothetical protein [Lacipirellulaceae bacterium]
MTIAADGPFGADVVLDAGQSLEAAESLYVGTADQPGSLEIRAGGPAPAGAAPALRPLGAVYLTGGGAATGPFEPGPGGFPTVLSPLGSLHLNGGTLTTATWNQGLGSFTWTAGELHLTTTLSVDADGALGDAVAVGAGRTLRVDGPLHVSASGSLSLQGGRLVVDELTLDPAGAWAWTAGTLEITGAGGLTIGPGGLLGDSLHLATGDGLTVAATTTLTTGGSLHVDGGDFVTGVLALAGGAFTAESLDGVTQLDFAAGSITLAGATGAILGVGGTALVAPMVLNAGDALTLTGALTLADGSALSLSGGAVSASQIHLTGGTLSVGTRAGLAPLDFQSGLLSITGDLTIAAGSDLGHVVTLGTQQHLAVDGTTTIGPSGNLILTGGSLSTGALALAGGTLEWHYGALAITGPGGLTLNSTGPLGPSVWLDAGRSLDVVATLTVDAGVSVFAGSGGLAAGQLSLAGGALTAVDLQGIGAVQFDAGALTLTGADPVVLGTGGVLPAGLTLDSAKSLSVAGALKISTGGSLIVEGGTFGAGHLQVDGGQFKAADLTGVASIALESGAVVLTGPGQVWFGPGSAWGNDVALTPGRTLQIAGTAVLPTGAELDVDGGVFTAGALQLVGGRYVASNLDAPASVNFYFGEIALRGDHSIAAGGPIEQALGGSRVIGAGRRLTIEGAATLLAPASIGGGRLTVGQLVNPQLLDFDAGTLDLAATDLTVGAGGLFGSLLAVRNGTTLN